MTRLQIRNDVIQRPGAKAAPRVSGDIRREPSLKCISLQPLACFVPAGNVLWRMAGGAMHKSFGKVSAAIPFVALVRTGLEFALRVIEQVPCSHIGAHAQRE